MNKQKLYLLKFSIGLSSGSSRYLGVFTSEAEMNKIKNEHKKEYRWTDDSHYKITEILADTLTSFGEVEW